VARIEQLNREAASNHPPVLQIFRSGANSATISVSGAPGRYILKGSTNLRDWQPVVTNVSPDGQFSASDPAQTELPKRVYRAEE